VAEPDVYMPDFQKIRTLAGLPENVLDQDNVTISTKLFKFLLIALVQGVRFEEAAYREAHADIAEAEQKGDIESLHQHYVGTGWFEGRSPGQYWIDDKWYLTNYRDLTIAFRRGWVEDLKKHFNEVGRAEGRAGSAEQAKWKSAWDDALGVDPTGGPAGSE
jgi:hypothetical protein